eukprot:2201771-Rhodomonas_salina.1
MQTALRQPADDTGGHPFPQKEPADLFGPTVASAPFPHDASGEIQGQESRRTNRTTSSSSRSFSAAYSDSAFPTPSGEAAVRAHDVIMQVEDPDRGRKIELSLQHFLDVTGAGELYTAARGRGVPEHFGCANMQVRESVEQRGTTGTLTEER